MKEITAILLTIIMAVGITACGSNLPSNSARAANANTQGASSAQSANTTVSNTEASTTTTSAVPETTTTASAAPATTTTTSAAPTTTTSTSAAHTTTSADPAPAANTGLITVVWYPNESSNTHAEIREEVNRLIEQATGRKAEERLTTDYTIAIEAIASGSADIAMAMGAVGYIEARNRNPAVDVLFVNSDADWGLDGAKYFAWLCVPVENADEYKTGDEFSIDNIRGKSMSFVSNSSTSGFRVPTSSIISHFEDDNLTEDDLIEGGRNMFFNEVYFGGSHQGSTVNLLNGNAEVAAFCDIELQAYIELVSGPENEAGSV